MQIRELSLKELEIAWGLLKQFHTHLEYKEFEDLIYEMRDVNYTMIGIFEKEQLIAYAGVAISTNFYDKRHLYVYEFIIDKDSPIEKKSEIFLKEYLEDYAKMAACSKVKYHQK